MNHKAPLYWTHSDYLICNHGPLNRSKSKHQPGISKSVATQWHSDPFFLAHGLTPMAPPLAIALDGFYLAGIDQSLHNPSKSSQALRKYNLAGSTRLKWNQKSLSEEVQSHFRPGSRWAASEWKVGSSTSTHLIPPTVTARDCWWVSDDRIHYVKRYGPSSETVGCLQIFYGRKASVSWNYSAKMLWKINVF